MRRNDMRPTLKIEGEFLEDRSGYQLKRYERQVHNLKGRIRKRLDQGMSQQHSAPLLTLMEACGTASSILPDLWRELATIKSR